MPLRLVDLANILFRINVKKSWWDVATLFLAAVHFVCQHSSEIWDVCSILIVCSNSKIVILFWNKKPNDVVIDQRVNGHYYKSKVLTNFSQTVYSITHPEFLKSAPATYIFSIMVELRCYQTGPFWSFTWMKKLSPLCSKSQKTEKIIENSSFFLFRLEVKHIWGRIDNFTFPLRK